MWSETPHALICKRAGYRLQAAASHPYWRCAHKEQVCALLHCHAVPAADFVSGSGLARQDLTHSHLGEGKVPELISLLSKDVNYRENGGRSYWSLSIWLWPKCLSWGAGAVALDEEHQILQSTCNRCLLLCSLGPSSFPSLFRVPSLQKETVLPQHIFFSLSCHLCFLCNAAERSLKL